MILENLDVWITIDPHHSRLTEYARVRSSKNTVECWIPSVEGKNFVINWDLIKRPKHARLGLACGAFLDGVQVPRETFLSPPKISAGNRGVWSTITTGGGTRKFLFGKLQMTDQEDRAPLDDPTLQDLNTIKVTIAWINGCKKVYYDEDSKPKETAQSGTENSIEADPPARWVNEQMAQKGHAGSAELGPLIPNPPQADSPTKIKKKKKKQDWHYKYQKVDSPPPLSFVFHYAPKEWLQDRGIIRQPAATPVVDLSATQPQPQPTQDENAHPSPAPHEELEQERAAPTTSTARNDSPRPKTEPLAPTDHGELLRLPLRDACLTGGAVSPGQGYAMNRDEKARLSPLTAPSINPSETQQSTGSRILSVKRERELSPPNFEVISSDDEIEILDIKPSKPITSKRPRMKYEDKDSKPTRETLESEPYVCHHEEIDPWRLGC